MSGNSPEGAQEPISAPKPVRWYTRAWGDWISARYRALPSSQAVRYIRYGGLFVEDIPRTPPPEPGWSWTDWDPAFDPPEDELITWEQISLLDPIRHAQHQDHPWEPPE